MSSIIREFTLPNLKMFRQMYDNKIANSYVKGNTTGNDYAEYLKVKYYEEMQLNYIKVR